jgi:hypothetical protein
MTTLTMARVRPKSNPPHVKPSHPHRTPDYETDEALWAAYRRYDKSAVAAKLLHRYLRAAKAVRRKRNFRRDHRTGAGKFKIESHAATSGNANNEITRGKYDG